MRCTAAALVLSAGSLAAAQQIIVPNELATVEGPANNTFPFTSTNLSQRVQQVHAASEFSALSGPHRLIEIRMRPDAAFAAPFSNTFTLDLRFSTTQNGPDLLSTTYSENTGPDETVVYSGQAMISATQFPGPGPLEFEVVITFQNPFIYNPANGHLLMDVRRDGHTLPATRPLDSTNTVGDGVSRLIANSSSAISGNTGSTGLVMLFVFEPIGAVCYANCDGSTTPPILNVADFGCFLSRFAAGDLYANCDGSTTPPVLNVADFGCFLSKFAAGCP